VQTPSTLTLAFTSTAANLEYEMLDSMFGALSPLYPLPDFDTDPNQGQTLSYDAPPTSNLIQPSWPASGGQLVDPNFFNPDPVPPTTGGGDDAWTGWTDKSGAAGEANAAVPVETSQSKGLTPSEVYRTVVKP
jgi:hypothetical protein